MNDFLYGGNLRGTQNKYGILVIKIMASIR